MLETDQLAKLVDQKYAVLTQLRALALRQSQVAQQSDTAPLISLMAVKQRLLDALVRTESQLDPFRNQDPEERHWPTPDDRARCAATSQQCQELLQEVMELDRCGMEILQQRQQKNKQHIDAAHQGLAARTAYVAGEQTAAQRIDIASD